jgi:hypothetical protein
VSYRLGDLGFVSPFLYLHCVPLAFTSVRDGDASFAESLARDARGLGLLNCTGGSPGTYHTAPKWAALAGLRIVETVTPEIEYAETKYTDNWGDERRKYRRVGQPTVTQFRKTTGKTGRWIVLTDRHAQSLVDGKYRGWHAVRSRVIRAWRVEIIPQEVA